MFVEQTQSNKRCVARNGRLRQNAACSRILSESRGRLELYCSNLDRRFIAIYCCAELQHHRSENNRWNSEYY